MGRTCLGTRFGTRFKDSFCPWERGLRSQGLTLILPICMQNKLLKSLFRKVVLFYTTRTRNRVRCFQCPTFCVAYRIWRPACGSRLNVWSSCEFLFSLHETPQIHPSPSFQFYGGVENVSQHSLFSWSEIGKARSWAFKAFRNEVIYYKPVQPNLTYTTKFYFNTTRFYT